MTNHQEFLDWRGIAVPCKKCDGSGVVIYGSTATWRGGIGGSAMTLGICNRCWGSGDENRKWLNLELLPRNPITCFNRLHALVKKWKMVHRAFTSPVYTVQKEMDPVKVIKQCLDELKEILSGKSDG